MSQFEVYPNPSGRTKAYPYVVQLQSDPVTLPSRDVVVAPLVPAAMLPLRESVLLPLVQLCQVEYRVSVPMMRAVAQRRLSNPVGNVSDARWTVLAAVDRLFTGG